MSVHRLPRFTTDGLLFLLDAENTDSNPGSGTTWYDISGNNNDATITGATRSGTDRDAHFIFDGSNDKLTWSSNFSISVHDGFSFWVLWDLPAQSSGAWNYFLYHDPSGDHKYEFGQYGTSADTFHFKDNISYAGTAVFGNMASTGYSSFAWGATSIGRTFTSVNGAAKTIKDPGSNSTWATAPTTPMIFDDLFTGAGSYLAANCKMLALYDRELTDDEIAANNEVANRRK